MTQPTQLRKTTKQVATLLSRYQDRLVLAESCTGGLLASLFTEIPGASDYFCGSQVVYTEGAKRRWLGVRATTLRRHSAVSVEVAEAMVRGVLRETPEATIAGAITGYLGPAGKHIGLVYFSVLKRGMRKPITEKLEIPAIGGSAESARLHRREIASEKLLVSLLALLNSNRKTGIRAEL